MSVPTSNGTTTVEEVSRRASGSRWTFAKISTHIMIAMLEAGRKNAFRMGSMNNGPPKPAKPRRNPPITDTGTSTANTEKSIALSYARRL